MTDSGVFDLSQLTASIERVPLQPKPDDTLLGIGSAPLPPPKAETVSRAKPKLVPVLAFVAMFGSVAFALHTSQRAVELAADARDAQTTQVTSGGESVVHDVEVLEEPVVEPVVEPVAESEPEVVAEAPVRRTSRVAATAPTPTSSPSRELGDRGVDELMRLATGLPEVPTSEPSTRADAPPLRTLRPDRTEVARVFRSLAPAIQRCAPEAEGVVTARVFLVGDTGRARSASVSGAEGSAASCMENALMNAEVEPFLQDRLEITFPYRL